MALDHGGPVPPPANLASRKLALKAIPIKRWWRIHRDGDAPCLFSEDPANRFSSAGLGVFYAADAAVTAFWEVFWDDLATRAPGERRISKARLAARVVTPVTPSRAVRVFDATDGRSLKAVSAPAGTFSGDYANCQRWAKALAAHPAAPEGIQYPSARHGGARCLALFAGPVACDALQFGGHTPVSDDPDILGSVKDDDVDVIED
jgi:hypothetical protein